MAKELERAYNTIELEKMELEIGDMSWNSYSFNQASDNTMNRVKMVGDEDCSGKLTEEHSDISEEKIINILEEEGGHFRLNSNLLVSGDLERNSTFSPSQEDVHERRNSTSVIIGASHNVGVSSRYLSTRLTSCHDLCKPEHKYYLEVDPKRHSLGTISGVMPLTRTTSVAASVSKVETKKKTLLRRSSLPGTILEKGPQLHTKKDLNCLKTKCIQSKLRQPWASTSGQSSSRSKIDTQSGKHIVVPSPKLQENSSQIVKEIETRKEIGSHSRGFNEKAKEPMKNPMSPMTPLTHKKSPSMKTNIYKTIQSISHAKNQSNSKRNKIKGSIDVPKKTLYMMEPSSVKETEKRALKASSSSNSLQNTDKSKEPKSNPSTARTYGVAKRSPSMKEKLHKNLKGISRSKNQNNPEEPIMITDMPEKTLYMIESSSDKKPPRRASISASSSKSLSNTKSASLVRKTNDSQSEIGVDCLSLASTSTLNLTFSIAQKHSQPQVEDHMDLCSINTNQFVETAYDGGSAPSTASAILTIDSNTKSESAGTSDPEEKDGSSWMVKFRTRTVVSFQVAEYSTNGLQLKSGRPLGDDKNDNDQAVLLNKVESTVKQSHDTKPETGKVLWRHQEVEMQDSLDLNNVIKEPISKNKVKALVNAFETMMSLRDRKPLVRTRVSRVPKNGIPYLLRRRSSGRHRKGVKRDDNFCGSLRRWGKFHQTSLYIVIMFIMVILCSCYWVPWFCFLFFS